MRHTSFVTTLLAAALLAGASIATADTPAPAGIWKLAVTGTAAEDAQLQFRITPQAGEPIVVTAAIVHGRGSIWIAKTLCDAFKAQLPKRIYRCEVLHGEDVYVKAGHEQPAFSLELVESTLTGARVQVSTD